MSAPIDEDIAWALVRAAVATATASPGRAQSDLSQTQPSSRGVNASSTSSRRVFHPTDADIWLDLHPSGRSRASAPTTRAARALFSLYLPLATRAELVIGQLGQSLDGRIATESGDSRYVTGAEDIRRLHRLRALVDAVVVGASTAATDDPRLTVREVEGANPVRVVLDPDGRLSPELNLFTDGAARTLLVHRASAGAPSTEAACPPAAKPADASIQAERPQASQGLTPSIEVIRLPVAADGGFDPALVLRALRARGFTRVLIEGGGITVSRFLAAGLLDRLHVCVAPMLIGSGRPAITLPAIESLSSALRPRCRHVRLGEDLLFDLELR